jgi:inositol transport system ATP-binding protein
MEIGMREYLLYMEHITKRFQGVTALDDVSFAVRAGEVHALVGENGAGKSTLMKTICGIYQPDNGTMFFGGKERRDLTPHRAIEIGISMIHQELSPVPEMSICENIFLGRELCNRFGFLDIKSMNTETSRLLAGLGVNYNVNTKMRRLTVAGMQMIEITKSIFRKANLIIMDEPTSSLTNTEIELLFTQIKRLRNQGKGIIYISHKMDEIFRIADYITVFRDGRKIATASASEFTMEKLITQMVGRGITNIYPKETVHIGDVALEIKNLTGKGSKFRNVSLSVRKGEILGVAGLVGAGRTEVMRAIFGLDEFLDGEILLEGKRSVITCPRQAIDSGITMASEDRRLEGLVLCRSVRENISLPNLRKLSRGLFLDLRAETEAVSSMIERLRIKVSSDSTAAGNLSGGNQQKVVLAKWLLRNVKVMILDEPTRGIDVGAKYEIYRMITDLVRSGIAVIMISSEMQEIMGMSDRVIVMSQGIVTGELSRESFDQETIMRMSIANIK